MKYRSGPSSGKGREGAEQDNLDGRVGTRQMVGMAGRRHVVDGLAEGRAKGRVGVRTWRWACREQQIGRVKGKREGSSGSGHSGVQCRCKGGVRRIAGDERIIMYSSQSRDMFDGRTGQREDRGQE